VHGRQAPKEHRRDEPTCIRSCTSLCVPYGASGLPSTVNFRLCPEAKVLPDGIRFRLAEPRAIERSIEFTRSVRRASGFVLVGNALK
jgi:hypothetical protein